MMTTGSKGKVRKGEEIHNLSKVPDSLLLKQSRQECGELKAYIDELEYELEIVRKQQRQNNVEWISCKEALPQKRGKYLAVAHGQVWLAEYLPDVEPLEFRWLYAILGNIDSVTHWAYLPQMPKDL